MKKKYGSLLANKTLISKDHHMLFSILLTGYLGKQKRNKAPLEEALASKLEATHNQAPSRRPSYAAIKMREDNDNDKAADEQTQGSGAADQKREDFQDHVNKT